MEKHSWTTAQTILKSRNTGWRDHPTGYWGFRCLMSSGHAWYLHSDRSSSGGTEPERNCSICPTWVLTRTQSESLPEAHFVSQGGREGHVWAKTHNSKATANPWSKDNHRPAVPSSAVFSVRNLEGWTCTGPCVLLPTHIPAPRPCPGPQLSLHPLGDIQPSKHWLPSSRTGFSSSTTSPDLRACPCTTSTSPKPSLLTTTHTQDTAPPGSLFIQCAFPSQHFLGLEMTVWASILSLHPNLGSGWTSQVRGLGHPGVPQLRTREHEELNVLFAGCKGKPVLSLIYQARQGKLRAGAVSWCPWVPGLEGK